MAKLSLTDISTFDSSSVLEAMADNNTAIETAMEKTLSRDGTSPNSMNADLDMNGFRVLNLSEATSDTEPVRLKEFNEAVFGEEINAVVGDNSITNTKLRDSGALSVIGRSANTVGDPGDISATAATGHVLRESGSTIGFGTVDTGGIADKAITLPKIQDIPTARLVGRTTAGSGSPETLTVEGGLEFSGTALRTSAFSGDVVKSAGSNTLTISQNAVANNRLADMAEATVKGRRLDEDGLPGDPRDLVRSELTQLIVPFIGAGVEGPGEAGLSGAVPQPAGSEEGQFLRGSGGWELVGTAGMENNAITFGKMQTLNTTGISGTQGMVLGTDVVGSASTAVKQVGVSSGLRTSNGHIVRDELVGDVTASVGSNATTIANNAVTNAKMADMASNRVRGRVTAGTGDPEDLTITQTIDMVGGTAAHGDVLFRNAGQWTRLGAGATGQFLKTNGPGADPQWSTVAAGGGGVTGPASSNNNSFALFNGTTGQVIKDSERVVLTANPTIFYVRSDGVNDNSVGHGLSDSPTEAFLTWQFAYDHIVSKYDFNGKAVFMYCGGTGPMTFDGGSLPVIAINKGWLGGGTLKIRGRLTGALNDEVVFTNNASGTAVIDVSSAAHFGPVTFEEIKVAPQHASVGRGLNHRGNGRIHLRNMHFFECSNNCLRINNYNSFCEIDSGHKIKITTNAGHPGGGTSTGILVDSGRVAMSGGVEFAASTVFANQFIEVNFKGETYMGNAASGAWTGTFTGKEYDVKDGGWLRQDADDIPGTIAGTVEPGASSTIGGTTINSGTVFQTSSSTDNAIMRWDGTTGRRSQNSLVTVSDSGYLSGCWNSVAKASPATAHTGTTGETVLATIAIPAAAMGTNGRVRGKVTFSYTSSVNSKTMRCRFGATGAGTGGTDYAAVARSSAEVGFTFWFEFANKNSASSQIGASGLNGNGLGSHGAVALPTSSVNTANATEIAITAQLGNSGETMTLESYAIEVLP